MFVVFAFPALRVCRKSFTIKLFFTEERNFSQRDIDELGKQESPTYCLLFELSHQGYAIKHLLLSLNENEMERIDVVHDITEWIDLELVQMSR